MPPIETASLAAKVRAFTFCLNRSRFSVIILVVGLGMLLSAQGRDVLVAYGEDGKTLRVAAASGFWALSIWGWSRLLLDVRYEDLPSCRRCHNFCRRWMPRMLGALAFLVVAWGAYQAAQTALVFWSLISLVFFLTIVIGRRPASNRIAAGLNKSQRPLFKTAAGFLKTSVIDDKSLPPYGNFWEMLGIPWDGKKFTGEGWKIRGLIALAMFLTFLVFAALGNFAPVWFGSSSGALILFFLWAATWLPVGSWMSYVADMRGIPLLTLLAVIALGSSYINDNHEIRAVEHGVAVDSRPSVTEAMQNWAQANRASAERVTPFVVVATAGGGIRAAYWTATLLGDLHDTAPIFPQRTFAISGVSGGSVGATVYRALLDIPPARLQETCPEGVMDCAQQILGQDFLGPLVAALFYPDLAQRFFPLPIFADRAAAFEKSLEGAFKKVSKDDRLNSSLGAMNTTPWAPALFLNATWVDNGRRIVASNLRYGKDNVDEAQAFARANDQLAVLGYDIRLSTAAHNSARFPFVSPPGMWKDDNEIKGRLQDGGLFENYGAETAQEILTLACRNFACPDADDEKKRNHPNIKPVVILISSDPELPPNLTDSPHNKPISFGYEVRSTFRAYEQVRGGRGAEVASQLEEWTRKAKGDFFYFRMCRMDSGAHQPPLGWALSSVAKETINSYIHGESTAEAGQTECHQQNMDYYQELRELLAR